MGEYADMMLEGMVCQWCGEYLGEGDGFPVVCAGCQAAENVDQHGNPKGGSTDGNEEEDRKEKDDQEKGR